MSQEFRKHSETIVDADLKIFTDFFQTSRFSDWTTRQRVDNALHNLHPLKMYLEANRKDAERIVQGVALFFDIFSPREFKQWVNYNRNHHLRSDLATVRLICMAHDAMTNDEK